MITPSIPVVAGTPGCSVTRVFADRLLEFSMREFAEKVRALPILDELAFLRGSASVWNVLAEGSLAGESCGEAAEN